MQGTVIAINRVNQYCDIYDSDNKATYRASLDGVADSDKLVVGDDCLYTITAQPTFLGPGKATLDKFRALIFNNDKVALTREASYPEHSTIKEEHSCLLAAEGSYEKECRSALIELALKYHVNALLDLKLEVVTRPGVKSALFRYTARPALITGAKYNPEPGQGMDIPTKLARRNSPNEAKVRYVRVLLLCFLFIAVPCVMSMGARGVFPSLIWSQIINAALIVMCMIVFLLVFFRKRQAFILTLKPINRK